MRGMAATKFAQRTEIKVKKPDKYKVVMYNDDFTPMDMVVEILVTVFHKNYRDAVELMMAVHKGQKAVVGLYPYDMARTKAAKAVRIARDSGYPFRVEVEK